MDRKMKIMGIYIGLLFFISILLILITSFSYSKIDPSLRSGGKQSAWRNLATECNKINRNKSNFKWQGFGIKRKDR